MTDPKTDSGQGESGAYGAAVRYVGAVVVLTLALLGLLLWSVNGCRTPGDPHPLAQCTATQRLSLAVGPALVLAVGGGGSFMRTYRLWRDDARDWWVWQGAGWFLLVTMLAVLSMTVSLAR